jgi:hypothetical protein
MTSVTGGSDNYIDIADRLRIDLQQQSSQKFLEAARFIGENFYHNEMKGLDWEAITREYHALALQTRTADEFNHVGNRFLGELNVVSLNRFLGSGVDHRKPGEPQVGDDSGCPDINSTGPPEISARHTYADRRECSLPGSGVVSLARSSD